MPPPAGSHVPGGHGPCTATDVTTFTTACITNGNCTDTGLSSAACYGCLYSESTSSSWGVIVDYGNSTYTFNVGGCYLAMGAPVACAAAAERQAECEVAACDATCSTSTTTDPSACVTSADSGECAAYVSAVTTACGTTYTSATACGAGTTTSETLYEAMAATFCE